MNYMKSLFVKCQLLGNRVIIRDRDGPRVHDHLPQASGNRGAFVPHRSYARYGIQP